MNPASHLDALEKISQALIAGPRHHFLGNLAGRPAESAGDGQHAVDLQVGALRGANRCGCPGLELFQNWGEKGVNDC